MGLTAGGGGDSGWRNCPVGSAQTPPLGAIRSVRWSNIGAELSARTHSVSLPYGREGVDFGLSMTYRKQVGYGTETLCDEGS